MVQKSQGCNHMFCTMCHTGFCYQTGKLLKDSEQTNTLFTEWLDGQGNKGDKHRDRLTVNQMILYGNELRISKQATTFYEKAIIELSSMYKHFENERSRMINSLHENQWRIVNWRKFPDNAINLFHDLNVYGIILKYMVYAISDFINREADEKTYDTKLRHIKCTIDKIEKRVKECLCLI
jgi:hypothetical protein